MKEQKPERKKTFVDYLLTVILIIAVGVFCFAGYKLISIYLEYKEGTDEYHKIAQMAVTVREPENEKSETDNVRTDNKNEEITESVNTDVIIEETNEETRDNIDGKIDKEIVRGKEKETDGETEEETEEKIDTDISEESGVEQEKKTISYADIGIQMMEVLQEVIESGNTVSIDEKQEHVQVETNADPQILTKPHDYDLISEKESKIEESETTEQKLMRLQKLYEGVSSIIKKEVTFQNSIVKDERFRPLMEKIEDIFLSHRYPLVWALDRLRDNLSAVDLGMRTAAYVRENGLGIDAPLEVDFEVLQNINEDVIGWIYVEAIDTINYPIVKGKDNDEYLHHTYEGKYNFAGTLFIDYENNRDFSDSNTLVYGHNMKNGSMFGQLKTFVGKPEIYEKSRYFWILTPKADYRYEIIAAYTTGVKSETYTLFTDPGKKYLEYIDKIREWSSIKTTERKFTVRDKIVTLSTCTGNESTRFVVQGIRVNTIAK